MAVVSPSMKFGSIYDSLPTEAQRILVERHLAQLLDSLPVETANKVVSTAAELQTRRRNMPLLDLKGKRKEVSYLMGALNRDSKISIIKERSNRDELLTEIMETMVEWLSDIWSVVYEYNENYLQAHACLMFTGEVLSSLSDIQGFGGCKCSLLNMPINITIKKQGGKVVKTFALQGPHMIDQVLLWIWRELLVSLSAYGTRATKQKIPDILEEIEIAMGWTALERLLYGGRKSYDEDDEDEDLLNIDDDDGDEDYVDEDVEDDESCRGNGGDNQHCTCPYHASHWSDVINAQRIPLRDLVENRLRAIFEITPSVRLYNIIISMSMDASEAERSLLQILAENAGNTPDTLTAALDIYTAEGNASGIISLLNSHSHLLRPRDAETLLCAVAMLCASGMPLRALTILEKELNDTTREIHASIASVFSHVDLDIHKKEFAEILKLRVGTSARADRIERWVDAIDTSSAPMHPMAFAAMMMGFPLAPGMDEGGPDAELAAFLDLDQSDADPDLEDLREEFRPKLKERFDAWHQLSMSFKTSLSTPLLTRVYSKAVELMPFLRAPDVVDQMIRKLSERPSKNHICLALETLSSFCKVQRKKISSKTDKQRRSGEKSANGIIHPAPPLFGNDTASYPFSFNASGSSSLGTASAVPPTPFGVSPTSAASTFSKMRNLTLLSATTLFILSDLLPTVSSTPFNPREYTQHTATCKATKRAPTKETVDIALRYVDVNPRAKETILMVHGWPSLWSTWSNQIQEFKNDYHLVVPNLRGFGNSTHPGDPRSSGTMGDLVGDLVCILEHANVHSAICMGHDWGSQLCYDAARMRPDIFTAVIGAVVPYIPAAGPFVPLKHLVTALPKLTYQLYFDSKTDEAVAELDQDIRRTLRATLRTVDSPPPDEYLTSPDSFLAAWADIPPIPFFTPEEEDYFVEQYGIQGFRNTLQFYMTENRRGAWELAHTHGNYTILQPALAVYPLNDPVADWTVASRLLKTNDFVPHLTTEVLEGAHWVHLEQPDKFNAIVRRWLRELKQDGAGEARAVDEL
ncbi:Bifunctional epoxide hydrolase 2 [Hypsizygus marmoreus]|uniref:Bifunctional epoxide hydrolase 2 n=1 Tax=Hypsizygus marmoreus TaxID=39966 RepID=A0A369JDR5_HYPMA|nr:Bifunctional epoxide hydrolase 2 [Hypsizygus marmoreus]